MENNEATIEMETEPLKPDTDTTKLPDDDTQNNGNSMLGLRYLATTLINIYLFSNNDF